MRGRVREEVPDASFLKTLKEQARNKQEKSISIEIPKYSIPEPKEEVGLSQPSTSNPRAQLTLSNSLT